MESKNKNSIIKIFLIVILGLAFFGFLLFLFMRPNSNKLSLEERRWLESNKYNVIDVSVLNDVPILGYNGSGIIYSYFDYIAQDYSLKFNIVSKNSDSNQSYNYYLDIANNISKNDVRIMDDNLILLTKDNTKYINFNEINNLTIGIAKQDKNELSSYFKNKNVNFVEFDSYEELNNAFNNDTEEETKFDGIITLKILFMEEIINNNYNISFDFNDLVRYYVLRCNGSNELNSILSKGYNIWSDKYYSEEYDKYKLQSYFDFKDLSDVEIKNLQSKKYNYGFIDYGIYSYLNGNSLQGLSNLIIKDFNEFSNLSIKYTRYNNISKMIADLENGKIDFALNIINKDYNNLYNTISVLNDNIVIISGVTNKSVVDSIYSLKDKEVLTVKDSILEKYLLENNVRVKSYNNMKDLVRDYKSSYIAILDLENYNYYKTSIFKDCKINYLFNLDNGYNFIVNDRNSKTFAEIFDFYLNFTSINKVISTNYSDVSYKNYNYLYILITVISILCFYIVIDFSHHLRTMVKTLNKNKKIKLSKEDKMKYIDQLTSLKNRAYFNSKIELWDESEIYPQAIIIIDLNNISYINDNYGREEGDKVITEAANILIQYQLENTEIIRTDGNEFMIYMVGYNDKQVVSYLRKLNKEFKDLSHGFGAASGYSIITDEIKTIDDAVNEATLDMKNNKEDIDY